MKMSLLCLSPTRIKKGKWVEALGFFFVFFVVFVSTCVLIYQPLRLTRFVLTSVTMLIQKSNILGIVQIPEDAANTDFSVILIIIEPPTTNTQLKWDFAKLFR